MEQPLLDVKDLHSSYGSGEILQGVSLQIGKGEIVATIGRNGVGKSTLMKTIMGILPALSGAVRFDGEEVTRLRPDQRAARGIGYVPQGREVFPGLTVEENLLMGESINRAKPSPGTFSGGQQQMLAIARALVGRPSLILLDEPSMGIQPNISQEIGHALLRLNKEERLTILLVEQNTGLIAQVAQRAYAMDKGRVVATLDRGTLSDKAALIEYLAV
jgi:branched-chain amino acid transport system ATP-binding protein